MVENRPWLTVFSHTVLILGIIPLATQFSIIRRRSVPAGSS